MLFKHLQFETCKQIDTPSFFSTANLPELKDVRAISELKVPAGWVERIPVVAANCGLFKPFILLKHYRAGNDMKYAYIYIERERDQI